jgi:hypothetical protein
MGPDRHENNPNPELEKVTNRNRVQQEKNVPNRSASAQLRITLKVYHFLEILNKIKPESVF